jgi:hypothetical protein
MDGRVVFPAHFDLISEASIHNGENRMQCPYIGAVEGDSF